MKTANSTTKARNNKEAMQFRPSRAWLMDIYYWRIIAGS
jgi:hypothetical protein